MVAESAGIARSAAYDVLAAGAAGAPFVQYKRAAFENPEGTAVAFTLDLVAKDLDLLLALADQFGVPVAQARANRAAVGAAVDEHLRPPTSSRSNPTSPADAPVELTPAPL